MEGICLPRLHEFRTERLVLRSPGIWDHAIMAATASDPEAQAFLNWRRRQVVPARRIDRALRGRPGGRRPRLRPPEGSFAIVQHGRVIGGAGVSRTDRDDEVEIGDYLAPAYRGRGLGTEAIAGLTEFVHRHLGMRRIVAGMHAENVASQQQFIACGYEQVEGPASYQLPNGVVVVGPLWWLHEDPMATARCAQY